MGVVIYVAFSVMVLPGVGHGPLRGHESLPQGSGAGGDEGHGSEQFSAVSGLHACPLKLNNTFTYIILIIINYLLIEKQFMWITCVLITYY